MTAIDVTVLATVVGGKAPVKCTGVINYCGNTSGEPPPNKPVADCKGAINLCNNRIQAGPIDVPNPFIR